jgi:NAD+ synthase
MEKQNLKPSIHPDLSIDATAVRKLLTEFLKTEIHRAGLSKAVVGLSGGIDSSVSCLLAVEALGAENVLGVCMPYSTSSAESLEHGQLIIKQAGIASETVPIAAMADPLIARYPDMDARRKGNIMARVRMIVLYDRSAEFKGLVVGTGNKTEIWLGYTTLYGDSACGLNPVGDLYKTQLRQLAHALDVPKVIIDKAPSADLWKGQTDEGELGLTYEEVDRLLYMLVDQRFTPEKCIEIGFGRDLVNKVVEIMRKTEFKRNLPPIARLSSRSAGKDLTYLRE